MYVRLLVKRAALILAALAALGWLGWRLWRGPDPATILANTPVPPAPVLSPEDELATFRVAPGFRVELVAAEPLVVDPVAIDWDDEGRLFVVEMRGFMPDVDGNGEDAPTGRIVVLEDTDADGAMDRSTVFADGLVLPRALAVLPQGVLIGERPNLWLCRDTDDDLKCDEKTRLTSYAEGNANPEHQENALLPGLDNWIYNARSDRRFRFEGDELIVEPTAMRGQWGMAQDDDGRLYYNHNSGFLYVDSISADYLARQPGTASSTTKIGVNVGVTDDEIVHGVRVAPGLNRAYLPGTLRADGRQNKPTGVSGLVIQRGDQYGDEYVGDAFVPEAAGGTVSRFSLDHSARPPTARHHLYDDPEWEQREFLASTHERFRPVDARVGPDGAVWIIDMYRGLIQHADFVSPHLRQHVLQHGLEAPGETGRLWRIVREDRPIARTPPPLTSVDDQVAALDHPNGWVRDRAQRRLVYDRSPEATERLRALGAFGPRGRRHALWILAGRGELDLDTWRRGLGDGDPATRRTALRAGESLLAAGQGRADVIARLDDDSADVRLQATHSLGALPESQRPLEWMLDRGPSAEPLLRQAILSGLAGLEFAALQEALRRAPESDLTDGDRAWLEDLAGATLRAVQARPAEGANPTAVLDVIAGTASESQQVTLLSGIATTQRSPGASRVELAEEHGLFDEGISRSDDVATSIRRVRRGFTWPGDPRPGGARALAEAEEARRQRGARLFADSCAACHGVDGRGTPGQAPSLVGSPWVRDSDQWLVRIVLQGLTGPVEIDGKEWNLTMPGHGDDLEHFGDEDLAGLLTFLRRAWGHAEDPVAPETVRRIRAETADRSTPWTVAELRALPIDHRLDRYVGIYEVPVIGTQIEIARQDSRLAVGQPGTGKAQLEESGDGLFLRDEMSIQFDADDDGVVTGARASYGGMSFPVSKLDSP